MAGPGIPVSIAFAIPRDFPVAFGEGDEGVKVAWSAGINRKACSYQPGIFQQGSGGCVRLGENAARAASRAWS